ncbi:MAG TPA: hypothetical protein VFZ96_04420 [Actinomycetota bacterium]|nr:hypothetical protein [Actinomycetota bacterium]
MDDARLRTYLNDHLAGASAAVWTLVRLAADHASDELGQPLADLRDQVAMDRDTLRGVVGRLPAGESPWKRALGTVGAVVAWGRNLLPGSRPTPAEELEALAIGVWGKRLLWGTLTRVAERDPRFADLDVEDLTERAEEQERELLRLRDRFLDEAFGLTPATSA